MKNEKYNGWKNYETWNVALWINNDECLYTEARDFAKAIGKKMSTKVVFSFVYNLFNGQPTPDGVKIDKKVNWAEIKNTLIEMI